LIVTHCYLLVVAFASNFDWKAFLRLVTFAFKSTSATNFYFIQN
jgi:hypothetical protein